MKKAIVLFSLIILNVSTGCLADQEQYCSKNDIFDLTSHRNKLDFIDRSFFSYVDNLPLSEAIIDRRISEYKDFYFQCVSLKITPVLLNELPSKELHLLYRNLSTIFFYTVLDNALVNIELVVIEKQKRGEKINNLQIEMHSNYIKARYFKKAKQLEEQNPNIHFEKLIPLENKGLAERNLIHLNKSFDSLILEPFSFPKDGHIVVVSALNCNASKRFFNWLSKETSMLKLFQSQATGIIPVEGGFHIEKMQQHYKLNNFPLHYVFKTNEWPEIAYWGTPSFYFYRNGKLITYFDGWPKEGRLSTLKQAILAIGLQTGT